VIDIAHFTLIYMGVSYLVFAQELPEHLKVSFKGGLNSLVPRIKLSLTFFPPVLDKAISLDLDHFVAPVTDKPNPWNRRFFQSLELKP
jgi:hypothetical protein